LQQIDQIESSVEELERTVMLMDEYTKQLEGKFRKLKEREREREKDHEMDSRGHHHHGGTKKRDK